MLYPSGIIRKSLCSIKLPSSSCNCQAICVALGQLLVSVIGAFQLLGNPVVSVSNINTSIIFYWGV